MANTLYNKQSHSQGPRVGLFDVPGTSTDTTGGNFIGGPYAEYVHQVPDDGNGNSLVLIEGWDTSALVARKIKVDSTGQVFIANAGTTSLGAIQIEVQGTDGTSTNVGFGTANLSVPVSGTFSLTPSGTQTVNGTVGVTQVTSPWVVSQGTATNLNATVVGTVTVVPSGTQNVKVIGDVTSGTASNFLVTSTPSGTQTISGTVTAQGTVATTQVTSPWVISGTVVPNGTVAVTQTTSPWVISGTVVPNGTVTIIPSGTQTVSGTVTTNGTVTVTPSGTQTITGTVTPNLELDRTVTTTMTGTANIATISCAGAGVIGMNITGTWTGTMSFQASVDGSNWLSVSPPAIHPAAAGAATTTTNGQWAFVAGGNNSFRINPTTFSSGTATVVLEANQAVRGVVVEQAVASLLNATVVGTVTNVPSGTQTITGTVVPNGTVTITPSGTQTVAGTVTSLLSGTAAVTQVTSPWVVSQGTASNLKNLANIGSTFNTGQVTVGTATGTTILASNTARIRIVLINTGTNAAYIGTATTVASTSGQYLAGIAGYPMAFRSTSAVCGIAAASTVTITYLEEVI